jgi:hypothetical protein
MAYQIANAPLNVRYGSTRSFYVLRGASAPQPLAIGVEVLCLLAPAVWTYM